MKTSFDFENNPEYNKLNTKERLDFLKAYITGRDPKTGRFTKGHPGNKNGRPRAKITLRDCLNKSFSKKVIVKSDGKSFPTTNLQLACDMIVQTSLAERDIKTLIMLLKSFGSMIDLSEELPPPKVRPIKEDPTVEMIKNAIFSLVDKELGVNNPLDDENNLTE